MPKRTKNHRNHFQPDLSDTVIAAGITVRGDITSDGDIWVNGTVEGDLTTETSITLGQNARIDGNLSAATLYISGCIIGNATATERVACESTAYINGDISTPRLRVEDGALITGRLDMPTEPLPETETATFE